MIVDSALYSGGARHDVSLDDDVLSRFRASCQEGDFIWVGLHEPDEAEMAELAKVFGLHPLAVEDAMTARQRPKVEPYDDMLFVVLKTLWYVDERDEVETGQVAMFIGNDFVVTVRQGAGVELSSVRHDLEDRPHLHGHGPSAVVYSVADRIVDGYEHVAAELDTDVDEVESSVFSPERTQDSQRIYVLKREIAEVRRAVHPLRLPMSRFAAASRRRRTPSSTRTPGRSSGTSPTTSCASTRRSTTSTPCSRRRSRRTSRGSRCSRTRTCERSRPGSPSRVCARWWPASTA
jgi:magnesium transporter